MKEEYSGAEKGQTVIVGLPQFHWLCGPWLKK